MQVFQEFHFMKELKCVSMKLHNHIKKYSLLSSYWDIKDFVPHFKLGDKSLGIAEYSFLPFLIFLWLWHADIKDIITSHKYTHFQCLRLFWKMPLYHLVL